MKRNLHFNGDFMCVQLKTCLNSLLKSQMVVMLLMLASGQVLSQSPCEPAFTIACPGDITVECGQENNLDITGTAGASGEFCDQNMIVTFNDEVLSSSPCGNTISRTWIITVGEFSQSCTHIITSQDTRGPVFAGLDSEIEVECFEEADEFDQAIAIDACSGEAAVANWSSQTGALESSCVATTAMGPGADWAIWLPTLSSASGANFVFNAEGGHFDQFTDGTAHMYGTVVNTMNVSESFIVNLWFEDKADWSTWSGQGRNYKNDLLLGCAVASHPE
jgi:hypothetical protein